MSDSGPDFYAWCDPALRVDAFAATLSTFARPGEVYDIGIHPLGGDHTDHPGVSNDEAIAMVRAAYGTGAWAIASLRAAMSTGRVLGFSVRCHDAVFEDHYPSTEPLGAGIGDVRELLVERLEIAIGSGIRSVAVAAAILSIQVQQEMEDLLRGLCAPNAQTLVTTGACSLLGYWGAPVEMSATYHADAMVARDLALSWVHLHDGDMTARTSGLSLDALAARVDAAPSGARVGVATNPENVGEHWSKDRAVRPSAVTRPKRRDAVRSGPRATLSGDVELTREQVLAALATPPGALLDALEACAVPDDEWRAVEPLALETIQATHEGAPTYDVDVTTRQHVRFLQQHAPYRVRRLPNGGVLLATHPYRVLWPLWADALFLLGITENNRGAG